ncbi:MAG: BTAD domain-containing putative transcriptional regulator, partial [Anaerolineae bacterium]
ALAPGYLQSGRVETLRRYLLALPPGFADEDPDLTLIHGHTLRYQGQVEEAARCYERARERFQARGDQARVCQAMTQLARVARLRGAYRQALELAEQAVDQAAPENHAERAEALMSLAKTAGFLHGMARGYRLGEEALGEARLAGTALSRSARARLLCSQAQLSWWYGDPFASVAHCQAALTEEGEPVTPVACQVHVVMATPYIYWGDLATARRMADQGLALAEQLQFTEWLPMAHATMGNILTRQSELVEGEAHLRRAIALSRELGVESYADLMASGFLAFNLTQQGRLVEGRRASEEALHLRAGSPETYELCVCRSVLGDVLLDMDDRETALEYFLNLRQVCTARQFRLPLAMVYFAIGYLHLVGGRPGAALEQIRRSLELVRHANAIQLYVDQGKRARVVCEAALEAGMHRDFVRRVLAALEPVTAVRGSARKAVTASEERRDGGPVIEVCCLGDFRLYSQGEELDRVVGLVGRPRQLLAYFITQGDRRVPLERVIEEMWPGSDPERGQAVFHTTLYRLRKALVRAGGPGDFVAHESGEYWLERERFRIDVDDFERELARARGLSGEAAMDACETAAALYGGPYLANSYEAWSEDERRRLAAAYVDTLRLLAVQATAAGDCHRAIRACEALLATDPLMEQVHCDVMRLWHRLGNRAAVTRQYETLKRLLADELAAAPLPETEALCRELVIG